MTPRDQRCYGSRRTLDISEMKLLHISSLIAAGTICLSPANAAFLIEVDIDGADDGNLSFSPNFSFGGDTTSASQSAPSGAEGMTGGDSIFGGNGSAEGDTYVFSYTPGVDVDNLTLAAGTPLNGADTASGIVGGDSGIYNIFATWPFTENVSGGLTTFSIDHEGGTLSVPLDQNGSGGDWINIGQVSLSSGNAYSLNQVASSNTFVSMRSAGVLFERVPEPSTAILILGWLSVCAARRRR